MKSKPIALVAGLTAGLTSAFVQAEFQKGYITIGGSSDIAPYAKAVSDRFVKSKKLQMPLLQASGTGGGIKLFCEGLDAESPDIALAVRPMKPKEIAECQKNGVGEVITVPIGYDAVILAQSKTATPLALTRKEARLGAAQWLVDKDGKMIPNPNKTWKDVNPALPAMPIDIHGPSSTSGVYDAFIELLSGLECKSRPWVPDPKVEPSPDILRKCRSIRDPGVYVNDPIDSGSAVTALADSPSELGIVDYKTLSENGKSLRAVPIDGIEPTYENIATQRYPGTQRLFLFVKGANLGKTPGLKDYVAEFASENAIGEKGYLKPLGLVTLLPEERAALRSELQGFGINPSTAVTTAPVQGGGVKAKPKKKK